MILELLPSDLEGKWEAIKGGLKKALEEEYTETKALNILNALMNRYMTCFISFQYDTSGRPQLYAFCITCFQLDYFTPQKNLMIYAMANFQDVPREMWKEDFQLLKDFAERSECAMIVAYTKHRGIVELADSLGFQEKYTYLTCKI